MIGCGVRAFLWIVVSGIVAGALAADAGQPAAPAKLAVEPGHAWTPPFGPDRVGRPMDAVVELPLVAKSSEAYVLVCYRDGKEIRRQAVNFVDSYRRPRRFGRVTLDDWPSEVTLLLQVAGQPPTEVARARVQPPAFEAAAVARPDVVIHPVDLGTILPPADWLLLAGGQPAEVEVAALSRHADVAGALATAWYESAPDGRVKIALPLNHGRKARATLPLAGASKNLLRDVLHVAIVDGAGREIWRKDIRVMLVPRTPRWPRFGAVETKLRYDQPIPVRGKPPIDFDRGWDPKRQDVVVFFPNGARFVFWRGSSYCPFWAGRSNTGFCYEWAEILGKHMAGRFDCVEPLQDKELRYGRVEIVESTPARVHVRWSYQSCDLYYKVWGDFAVEDFYFYPDALGTRVLTLTAHPDVWVETNEFIVFTPQAGYPFAMVPADLIDMLWPAGKASFRFPCFKGEQPEQWAKLKTVPKDVPLLYRIRFGKADRLAAIHYSPRGSSQDLPGFEPFYDRGALATPMYWGCHWPLSRGYPTAYAIERPHRRNAGPQLFHARRHAPTPAQRNRPDAQCPGETGNLEARHVGLADRHDRRRRRRTAAVGPELRPPAKAGSPRSEAGRRALRAERRALCLTVENPSVTITITPDGHCVNPVFELAHAPKTLSAVRLDDRPLAADRYRWDGATLWLNARLDRPATLKLEFAEARHNEEPAH